MTHAEYTKKWYRKNPIGKSPEFKDCQLCSKNFGYRKNKSKVPTFCSRSCSDKARSKKIVLVCTTCQKEYTVRKYREKESKYCSNSCHMRHYKGELSPHWKGGTSNEREQWQGSLACRLWRTAVFKRDKFTCVHCGDNTGGNLQADHIKPWACYPELREDIDNGRTLCIDCHKKTDTWGMGTKKLKKQLEPYRLAEKI